MPTKHSPELVRVSVLFALLQWARMDGVLYVFIGSHVCMPRLVEMLTMYSDLERTPAATALLVKLMNPIVVSSDTIRDTFLGLWKPSTVQVFSNMLESEDTTKATWALTALRELGSVSDWYCRFPDVVNAELLVRLLDRVPHDALHVTKTMAKLDEELGKPRGLAAELARLGIASRLVALMDRLDCQALVVQTATYILWGTKVYSPLYALTLEFAHPTMMEKVIEAAKSSRVENGDYIRYFRALPSVLETPRSARDYNDAVRIQDDFRKCQGLRWGIELLPHEAPRHMDLLVMLIQYVRGNECSVMEVLRAGGATMLLILIGPDNPKFSPYVVHLLNELVAGDQESEMLLEELLCLEGSIQGSNEMTQFIKRQRDRLRTYDKAHSRRTMLLRKRECEDMGADFTTVEAYLCPITRDIMLDPVVASDGNTYERDAIEHILREGNGLSPFTRERLQPRVYPNIVLRGLVHEHFEQVAKAVDAERTHGHVGEVSRERKKRARAA